MGDIFGPIWLIFAIISLVLLVINLINMATGHKKEKPSNKVILIWLVTIALSLLASFYVFVPTLILLGGNIYLQKKQNDGQLTKTQRKTGIISSVLFISALALFVAYEQTPMAAGFKIISGVSSNNEITKLPDTIRGTAKKGTTVVLASDGNVIDTAKISKDGTWKMRVSMTNSVKKAILCVTNDEYDTMDDFNKSSALTSKEVSFTKKVLAKDKKDFELYSASVESEASSSSSKASSASSSSKPKPKDKKDKKDLVPEINSKLAASLTEDQGFAEHNQNYAAAPYVESISVTPNATAVHAKVTGDFMNLSDNQKIEVARYVQKKTVANMLLLGAMTDEETTRGIITQLDYYGEKVVKTRMLDNSEYKVYPVD